MNISSIVVKTTEKDFEAVASAISAIKGCEIYLTDKDSCHIIVVLEVESTGEEIAINKQLESLGGVISANMHYAYQENELDKAFKNIRDEVSSVLDDSVSVESVGYGGSIEAMMKKH